MNSFSYDTQSVHLHIESQKIVVETFNSWKKGIDIYTHNMIHYEKKSVKLPRQNILLEAFHLLIFILFFNTNPSKIWARHVTQLETLTGNPLEKDG